MAAMAAIFSAAGLRGSSRAAADVVRGSGLHDVRCLRRIRRQRSVSSSSPIDAYGSEVRRRRGGSRSPPPPPPPLTPIESFAVVCHRHLYHISSSTRKSMSHPIFPLPSFAPAIFFDSSLLPKGGMGGSGGDKSRSPLTCGFGFDSRGNMKEAIGGDVGLRRIAIRRFSTTFGGRPSSLSPPPSWVNNNNRDDGSKTFDRSDQKFRLFISCLPGLEPLLLREIRATVLPPPPLSPTTRLDGNNVKVEAGGVSLTVCSVEDVYACHLYLGTASHVYLRCGQPFLARNFEELERKATRAFRWREWMPSLRPASDGEGGDAVAKSGTELDVRVAVTKSRVMHSGAISERVRDAIIRSVSSSSSGGAARKNAKRRNLGKKKVNDVAAVRLLVRLHRDLTQISIDTSGSGSTPLHRRGYRLETAKAPLREDLAYALLLAGGVRPRFWSSDCHEAHGFSEDDENSHAHTSRSRSVRVLDPFCGSGTIAIEGAAMLAGLPPGRFRPPPLRGTALCDKDLWRDMVARSTSNAARDAAEDVVNSAGRRRGTSFAASGCDRDAGAIAAARANAQRAGVSDLVDFRHCSFGAHPQLADAAAFAAVAMKSTSLLVATNPPYGKRISSDRSLLHLYQKLGHVIKSSSPKNIRDGCSGSGGGDAPSGDIDRDDNNTPVADTKCAILGRDPSLLRRTGLPLEAVFSTKHGGLGVVAMTTPVL